MSCPRRDRGLRAASRAVAKEVGHPLPVPCGGGDGGRRRRGPGWGNDEERRRELELPASDPPTHAGRKEAGEEGGSMGRRAGRGPPHTSGSRWLLALLGGGARSREVLSPVLAVRLWRRSLGAAAQGPTTEPRLPPRQLRLRRRARHKMLICSYFPNGSLDHFLSGEFLPPLHCFSVQNTRGHLSSGRFEHNFM